VVSTEVPVSTLSVVINQNGSPVKSATVSDGSSLLSAQIIMNCTSGDVITVVLSSSSPIDNQLNTVRTLVTLRQGQ